MNHLDRAKELLEPLSAKGDEGRLMHVLAHALIAVAEELAEMNRKDD